MEIREAEDCDIQGIISVLKASLGESKLPKSERVWRYKHNDNPFGKSLVLIAIEDDIIIGVRAFMRWKWQYGKEIFSTFRAVDTATHPAYQGKGVFKKLTLKAIELGAREEDDFIFNTPNEKSLPGYLKMGWEQVGKLKINLMLTNPLNWINRSNLEDYIENSSAELGDLINIYNQIKINELKLFTPKSLNYLIWRYKKNPLQNYLVYTNENFYVAGYIKEHKYFRELRIVEHLFNSKKDFKSMIRIINLWGKNGGVQIVTLGKISTKITTTSISGNFGPVLTFRNINLNTKLSSELLCLKKWNYSLGDLELF